jgi:hypothetical protein
MLSHELVEVRQIGETVKQVARDETPTLVKYADAVPYLVESAQDFIIRTPISDSGSTNWCRLMDYDPQAEHLVLAALLYRFGEMPHSAVQHVTGLSPQEREEFTGRIGPSGEHDIPARTGILHFYVDPVTSGVYAEFAPPHDDPDCSAFDYHLGAPRLV